MSVTRTSNLKRRSSARNTRRCFQRLVRHQGPQRKSKKLWARVMRLAKEWSEVRARKLSLMQQVIEAVRKANQHDKENGI